MGSSSAARDAVGSNSAARDAVGCNSVAWGPVGFNSAARDVVGFSSVAIASCRSIKLHVINNVGQRHTTRHHATWSTKSRIQCSDK